VRIVFVPGFTQPASSWDRVRDGLAGEHVALDVPDGLDFTATAHEIGDAGGRAIYVAYSMGGRLALRLAVDRPDLVAGLALLSASPGIADHAARAARRESDDALARDVERDGLDAFLSRWLAQPMFSMLDADDADVAGRRAVNTVDRLTHQLRVLGQGAQEPLWSRLHELAMPVELAAGALDAKYARLAAEMAASIGTNARVEIVAGLGHALHLQDPDAARAVVERLVHRVTA
jgi:2-succinyl-6-hydroxy-2,4-cyclohexadiene-1-carboxylate synthase